MPNKITLTAIKPLGHNSWYINGDSLADINLGRLIAPEGFAYEILSSMAYALYHGREGVRTREVEFSLKPFVEDAQEVIVMRKDHYRVLWLAWCPWENRVAYAVAPALYETDVWSILSEGYETDWDFFKRSHVCTWWDYTKAIPYSDAAWESIQNKLRQIHDIEKELEELFRGPA